MASPNDQTADRCETCMGLRAVYVPSATPAQEALEAHEAAAWDAAQDVQS